jgi:hypothetical protein
MVSRWIRSTASPSRVSTLTRSSPAPTQRALPLTSYGVVVLVVVMPSGGAKVLSFSPVAGSSSTNERGDEFNNQKWPPAKRGKRGESSCEGGRNAICLPVLRSSRTVPGRYLAAALPPTNPVVRSTIAATPPIAQVAAIATRARRFRGGRACSLRLSGAPAPTGGANDSSWRRIACSRSRSRWLGSMPSSSISSRRASW